MKTDPNSILNCSMLNQKSIICLNDLCTLNFFLLYFSHSFPVCFSWSLTVRPSLSRSLTPTLSDSVFLSLLRKHHMHASSTTVACLASAGFGSSRWNTQGMSVTLWTSTLHVPLSSKPQYPPPATDPRGLSGASLPTRPGLTVLILHKSQRSFFPLGNVSITHSVSPLTPHTYSLEDEWKSSGWTGPGGLWQELWNEARPSWSALYHKAAHSFQGLLVWEQWVHQQHYSHLSRALSKYAIEVSAVLISKCVKVCLHMTF